MAEALRASGLGLTAGGRTILHGVDLSMSEGELVALVGPNGAGKTSLLRRMTGLAEGSGEVRLAGMDLAGMGAAARARAIAYLPQGHVFHWPLEVTEVVALGRLPHARGGGLSVADREAVEGAMKATGVTEFAARKVTTLSGGEKARVALARVLATGASLLLADEPTTSLDPHYQLAVADILRSQARGGGAVLVALHDLALAARYADRIIVLDQGRIVADGPPREVLSEDRLRTTFRVEARIIDVDGAPVAVPLSARNGSGQGSGEAAER